MTIPTIGRIRRLQFRVRQLKIHVQIRGTRCRHSFRYCGVNHSDSLLSPLFLSLTSYRGRHVTANHSAPCISLSCSPRTRAPQRGGSGAYSTDKNCPRPDRQLTALYKGPIAKLQSSTRRSGDVGLETSFIITIRHNPELTLMRDVMEQLVIEGLWKCTRVALTRSDTHRGSDESLRADPGDLLTGDPLY